MWQLETAATSASSGSTAEASEKGSRTECGELDAGTELSVEVGAMAGWQTTSETVPTPALGSSGARSSSAASSTP